MRKAKPDSGLADKSDEELAADLRQFHQETVRFRKELERRGYDVNCYSYTDCSASVEINQVSKSVL